MSRNQLEPVWAETLENYSAQIAQHIKQVHMLPSWHKNQPAAQAAGAELSQWSSTNGQNQPIQQKRRNFWTGNAIWMPFGI